MIKYEDRVSDYHTIVQNCSTYSEEFDSSYQVSFATPKSGTNYLISNEDMKLQNFKVIDFSSQKVFELLFSSNKCNSCCLDMDINNSLATLFGTYFLRKAYVQYGICLNSCCDMFNIRQFASGKEYFRFKCI